MEGFWIASSMVPPLTFLCSGDEMEGIEMGGEGEVEGEAEGEGDGEAGGETGMLVMLKPPGLEIPGR